MECKCSSTKGRNLVICIDGTSNQFGPKNTNVIELYSQIIKSSEQLTYYNSGIGTYAKPSWKSWSYLKQAFANKVDLAIAWNFEKIIISAYRWLSENYQENDRIYLFGFSRGAYQVRTLAGMIHKVGLIHKGNEDQIPFAYELYLDQKSDKFTLPQPRTFLQQLHYRPQPTKEEPINLAERFKLTFSHENVKVHFVGVWDTVSSIGIVRGRSLPLTDTVDHVCFFRHALALDERRVKFLPEYGSKPVQPNNNDPRKFAIVPRVKEVWFPGTHSDIGGGNRINLSLNLGKTPALWMSFEAICCGLSLKPNKVEWNWEDLGHVEESLTSIWRLFEWIPFKRLTYKDGTSTTYRLHRGRGRKIWAGQKIHASVAFCPSTYRPRAVLPPSGSGSGLSSWDERTHKNNDESIKWLTGQQHIFEMDMFDLSGARIIVNRLSSSSSKQGNDYELWLHRLMVMTGFVEGRSALLNADAVAMLGNLLKDGPESAQSKAIQALAALCQDKIPAIQDDEAFNIIIYTIGSSHAATIRSLAVGCLTHISLGKPRWRKILENRTLDTISELLMDKDHHAVSETLEALGELLQYGEFREMLLTSGTITIAQTLFVTCRSLDAIRVLIDHEELCARLYSDIVVDATVERLGSWPGPETIVEMASISAKCPRLQRRLFGDVMIATIRKLLDSGEELAIKTAMGLLSSVINHGDLRARIFDDNTITAMIPAIMKVLGSTRAVEWLSLAVAHDDVRTRLFDNTMIASMTAAIKNMLGSNDNSTRDVALELLSTVACYKDLRAELFDNATRDAIPKLLNSDVYQEKGTALKLFLLGAKYEDLRAGLFDDATKAAIPKLLNSEIYRARETAIELLSLAANHDELRTSVFDDTMMSAVKDLLRSEKGKSIDAALKLFLMATNHEGLRTRLFDDAIKDAIPKLLSKDRYGARETTLELLSTAVKYEDLRTTLFGDTIIPALNGLLRSDNGRLMDPALKVLLMASNYEDARTRLFDDAMRAAMVLAIPRMLSSDSESSIEAAIELLPFAVNHEDLRTKLLNNVRNGAIAHLLRTRGHWDGGYALKLFSIASNHDDLRTELFDGAVAAAVMTLLGTDEPAQKTALRLLSLAVNHEDLRTWVFEDTTIAAMKPAIAGMLGSDTGSTNNTGSASEIAVQLLFLCANYGDLRAKIFDDSIKVAIAKLLDNNSYVHRGTALTLLIMAVDHEDLRTRLFDDAIRAAITKLLTYDHHGREQNLVVLLSKAANHEDLRTRLFDTDMKAAIVRLLNSEDPHQRTTSLELLSMTASHAELRAGLFSDAMQAVIPKLLSTVYYREKDTALKLLLVATNYGNLRARLFDEAMKAAIPELLCSRGYSTRETAVGLLSLAVNHVDLRSRFFDNAMISAIVTAIGSLLGSDDELERITAMTVLSVAVNSDLRARVFNNNLIPAMIPVIRDLLCSKKELARKVTSKLLSTAADHEDLHGRLFEDAMTSVIPNVLTYDHYGIRETALELLSLMANHEELRPMLLANRVMSAVRNILSQDIPQTASQALNFLGKTANYAEFGDEHDMTLSLRSSGDDASHRPLLTGRPSSRHH